MPLDQSEAIRLGVALLGGGAAGAVITAIVSAYRNRVQPVRYELKTVPVFANPPKNSTLDTIVTLRENGKDYGFRNLYLTELRLMNAGNLDVKTFTLGITLSEKDRIVNASCDSPDRHHAATQTVKVSAAEPKRAIDFRLVPFNRMDV
jgi:hypothetical protein